MIKKIFPKIESLDNKKNAELRTNMLNRNRAIQKEYALAEKQSQEDMKRLKKQEIAAMKRIKQTCKKEKNLISYYNQFSC